MKPSLILIILSVAVSTSVAQEAKHSTFTPKQIAEHLGLLGGNWIVSFDEKQFCGFVLTETSEGGVTEKKYYWSSESSKNHQFFFKHDIEKELQRSTLHRVKFSSVQEGDWTAGKDSAARWKTSGGSGMTYNANLPSGGGSRTQFRNNSVKIKPDLPELLYSWNSEETKRAFKLEILFTEDTAKAEQGGADQPAIAPESKSEGKEKPRLESEGRSQ
jgi:hypothetical protein